MPEGVEEERVPVPERSVEERVNDFDEVPLGYDAEMAKEEARRCLQCDHKPCVEECPVNVNITEFNELVAEGKFEEAYDLMKQYNAIPAITGRVCPQEEQCEGACVMGNKWDAINIGKLERFVADYARENNLEKVPEIEEEKDQQVAVIVSGPTGITCAVDLAKEGYDVVMYEGLHKPGGVLRYGIPEFRLPNETIDNEFEYLEELGVDIQTNTLVGKTLTFDEVVEENDAVYAGTGAGAPLFLGLPGENLNNVLSANEFLTRNNLMCGYRHPEHDTPMPDVEKVAVIGAGNVAMDSARTALRLGAEAHIVYRRTVEYSPARDEEVEHAQQEGVQFDTLQNPKRFIGKDGWLDKIKLVEMELGEPDDSGRPHPEPIEGSEHEEEFDAAIMAIGQRPNRVFYENAKGVEVKDWGGLIVDENMMTTRDGVFAGGDAVSGAATVILAMGDGRKAAKSIMDYLENKKG